MPLIKNSTILSSIGGSIEIYEYPNKCPLCHHAISTTPFYQDANIVSRKDTIYNPGDKVEIIFRCPNCFYLFIGLYLSGERVLRLEFLSPCNIQKKEVHSEVINISPDFELIFQQANKAYNSNMKEIAGCGFRKSLEFLVKDYCSYLFPQKADKIKEAFLSKCIEQFIEDKKIKECAKRATWLGNDETHYERVWKDKDITDLIKLLDLVMHWIIYEEETKKYLGEMHDKQKL